MWLSIRMGATERGEQKKKMVVISSYREVQYSKVHAFIDSHWTASCSKKYKSVSSESQSRRVSAANAYLVHPTSALPC